jgi:hypothetical protein
MAYHLSVVEILEEINQQDTPPSSDPHTPQMTITLWGVVEPKRRLSGSIEWSITGKSIC